MAVLPTSEQLERLGQLQHAQFPNTPDVEEYHVHLEEEISVAAAEMQRMIPTHWTSADANIQQIITRAIAYRALGSLWQEIKATMDGYDAEALPPEYVDPEQAAENRNYYHKRSKELVAAIETNPSTDPSFVMPAFDSAGLDQDSEYTTGPIRRWADTGIRGE